MPRSLLRGCLFARGVYSDLYRVFPAVVHKGNRLVGLLDTINRHTCLAIDGRHAQDGDVVDRFPIPVVHVKAFPIRRDTRGEKQLVLLQPQPQE
jgi:hypothetical protein